MALADVPLLFWGVYAFFAVERALEIAIHRRNSARLRARGAVWVERDGFPLIAAAQVALFTLVALEVVLAPYAGLQPWTWAAVGALALAQALRYWCIATLGDRWNVRVVTVPGEPPERGGPYRWLRHPNYVVVLAEVVLLPLAFGAWIALAALVPLKGVALWRRIRIEDRALRGPARTHA